MPGDVGLVAKFLSEVLDVFVDPTKYEAWDLEKKLKWLMRGVTDAAAKNDAARIEYFLAEYRSLRGEIGP